MAQETELGSDEFATYRRDDRHAELELRWSAATKSMSERQFRAAIERLAELLEQTHTPNVLIDVVEFVHESAPDFEEWRQARIIPRYNAAGVKKFAFLLPADAPNTVEKGVEPAREGTQTFPTGYFNSRERALAWFDARV